MSLMQSSTARFYTAQSWPLIFHHAPHTTHGSPLLPRQRHDLPTIHICTRPPLTPLCFATSDAASDTHARTRRHMHPLHPPYPPPPPRHSSIPTASIEHDTMYRMSHRELIDHQDSSNQRLSRLSTTKTRSMEAYRPAAGTRSYHLCNPDLSPKPVLPRLLP